MRFSPFIPGSGWLVGLAPAFFLVPAGFFAGCVDQAKVRTYACTGRSAAQASAASAETLDFGQALATTQRRRRTAFLPKRTIRHSSAEPEPSLSAIPTVEAFQPNFTVEQAPKGTAPPVAPGAPPVSAASATTSKAGPLRQNGNVLRRFEGAGGRQYEFCLSQCAAFARAGFAVVQQKANSDRRPGDDGANVAPESLLSDRDLHPAGGDAGAFAGCSWPSARFAEPAPVQTGNARRLSQTEASEAAAGAAHPGGERYAERTPHLAL